MRKAVSCSLAVVLFAAVGLPAQSKQYWVDVQNGSDTNPGSRVLPFRTITHSLTRFTSNAVLHVRPGVYSVNSGESLPLDIGAARAHQNVKILGVDPATCIVDMGSDGTTNPWSNQGKPNKNGAEPALVVHTAARNIEISGLQFRNGPGTATSGWDGWWHQCLAVNDGARQVDIHNCIFHKVNRGTWVWGAAADVAIHDNIYTSCWNDASGSNVNANAARIYVFNNTFVEAGASGRGNAMWPSDQCGTMYIVNNISYKAKQYGFRGGVMPAGMQFENNCSFGHTNGPWTFGTTPISKTNITADPALVNPTANPATGDYHLRTGSPCIEAGYPKGVAGPVPIPVVNDFYGNARVSDYDSDQNALPDIGAHEVVGLTLSVTNFGQGNTATFALARNQPQVAVGFLFLGIQPLTVAVNPFGSIGVDLSPAISWRLATLSVPGSTQLPIPKVPFLDDVQVYFQAWAMGPGASWRPSGRLDLIL